MLFKFYHVSCEGSKSGSIKKKDGIEMAVGYAWAPLLHNTGRYIFTVFNISMNYYLMTYDFNCSDLIPAWHINFHVRKVLKCFAER